MNSQELPQWTQEASGRVASEPPPAFLAAVRTRRMRRRVRQCAGVAGVLAVALAASMWSLKPASEPTQVAIPGSSRPVVIPELSKPFPSIDKGSEGFTLASFYTTGTADEGDSSAGAVRGTEPVLRGGDKWDLDRVRAWVLN